MEKNMAMIFFNLLEPVHLKKDVGLFPIYLSRYFKNTEIIYPNSQESLPKTYRGFDLYSIGNAKNNIEKIQDIIAYAFKVQNKLKCDKITHIMVFHFTLSHCIFLNILKCLNKKLKIYVKFDTSVDGVKKLITWINRKKRPLHKIIIKKAITNIDIMTIENMDAYEILKKSEHFKEKIYYAPNGYDDALLRDVNFEQKKKQIITVGRLGTTQKNTRLLLDILRHIDLKDWSIQLVGPIEETFQGEIEVFFNRFPEKKRSVLFTGEISDPEELVQIYQESSVFVLTSRWESSALVLIEAAMNGDYILTTDVGSARDLLGDDTCLYICPDSNYGKQNEERMIEHFSNHLQKIINGEVVPYEDAKKLMESCRETRLMSKICDQNFYRKWAE